MRKLIVQVRVNEGQMRDANPHVPYAPEEIAYPEFGHPTNTQLVERVVQIANSMGCEISSAAEVRQLFGLNT